MVRRHCREHAPAARDEAGELLHLLEQPGKRVAQRLDRTGAAGRAKRQLRRKMLQRGDRDGPPFGHAAARQKTILDPGPANLKRLGECCCQRKQLERVAGQSALDQAQVRGPGARRKHGAGPKTGELVGDEVANEACEGTLIAPPRRHALDWCDVDQEFSPPVALGSRPMISATISAADLLSERLRCLSGRNRRRP